MGNPWFRMYHEWDSDPKVQMMSEEMQRRLVMLFCSHCKGETLHETERAFHWRISETELAKTKKDFMQKGFIDGDWNVVNWNRRQFLSDNSTDRVRRHRSGLKQDETFLKQDETANVTELPVTVTPPDTDTDTEQIQKHKKQRTPKAPPSASAQALPVWISERTWAAFEEMRKRIRKPLTERARELTILKLDKWRGDGYDPEVVLNEAIEHSWTGVWPTEAAKIGSDGGSNGTSKPSATKQRVNANKQALADAVKRRGWAGAVGPDSANGGTVPLAGS